MRRTKFPTILAILVLMAALSIGFIFIPMHWEYSIERVIAVPLLIAIVWYFSTWRKRRKSQLSPRKVIRNSYLTLIIGIFVFGISVSSLILVPLIWPTIGTFGSRVLLVSLLVGIFFGLALVTQWFISRL